MARTESDYPTEIRRLTQAVLDGPGETAATLRRAVEARAARLAAGERADLPLPTELDDYVRKVALRATAVTDGDVAALRAAGYPENAVFELTVAAALGAGLARLERGRLVLAAAGGNRDRADPAPPPATSQTRQPNAAGSSR